MDAMVTAKATFDNGVADIKITETPPDPTIIVVAQAQVITTLPPIYKVTLNIMDKE